MLVPNRAPQESSVLLDSIRKKLFPLHALPDLLRQESRMKADPWIIEQVLSLEVGERKEVEPCGVTAHRYRDGWWLLWDNPRSPQDLGRAFAFREQLTHFLSGDRSLGVRIML